MNTDLFLKKYELSIEESKLISDYLNKYMDNKNNLYLFYKDKPYRDLSFKTKFKFCEIMGDFMRQLYGLYEFDNNSKIFENINYKIINKQLNDYGYYITNIDESFCDKILNKVKNMYQFKEKVVSRTNTTTWIKNMGDILDISEVQELVTDQNLLNIVQNFFNCKPILSQTNFWKSTTGNVTKKDLSTNAQLFHRDFDHEKWIKIFIYLNDIDVKNGPHCFVKGSQNKIIEKTRKKRYDDSFIENNFNKDDIKYHIGKKGTIIFENTRGFHKGTHVLENERNILQLEFSINKQYYHAYSKCIELKNPTKRFNIYNKKYPYIYQYIKYL